jgi:heme/copper-type cytochrome/quinol oxidase subunit 2
MLAGSVAILALVLALLALAFMRKSGKSPSQRTWIVWLGLVFPGVVLAALLAYGLVVGEKLLPRAGPEVVQVAAEAERWRWTFTQEAPDGTRFVTVGTLHIPANRPVDVAITTRDVIHSFWVPRLAGKLDAIPGRTNVLRIEASAPGVYEAQCAEYCGIGHSGHNFRVIAHDWGSGQ